ncbi:hypothetical protein ACIP4X_17930 [Streptomyces sp. NPDC088817]|uniref:hypothetical protein n=1 Tax=Streptomyces sp. NPDC088817 TaxID=3365907 RepID=UPI0037FD0AF1
MTDTWVRLPADTVQAISDALEAKGWQVEYATDSEMEIVFPDPQTGYAMRFSEWWLSWRLVDGRLAYGLGDDLGDPWRKQLDVDADAAAEVVAAAADRAMHLLWHLVAQEHTRKVERKIGLLWAMKMRMAELGRRLVVTPGMVRSALKESNAWTP